MWSKMMFERRVRGRIANVRSTHYLLYLRHSGGRRGERLGRTFEEKCLGFRVQAGLGQDLLRSSMLNDEVDRESRLFLSSGPPVAKACGQDLGTKVGGRSSSWSADRNFSRNF